MGRFVKNTAIKTGSNAVKMPSSTTEYGPQYPVDGQLRFNEGSDVLQYYANEQWNTLGVTGRVQIVKDTFVGDDYTTTFGPMTVSHTAGDEVEILVFINNIFQDPNVAFTVDGTDITFTSPPPLNAVIVILHNFNSTYVSVVTDQDPGPY